MSHITDLILITGCEDPPEDDKAEFVCEHLLHVDSLSQEIIGGDKVMQCEMWLAAVNHFSIPDMLERFRSIQWKDPDQVQLFVKDEHDDRFRVYVPDFSDKRTIR